MRSKLRNLLELWGDGGLLVRLTLVNGEELVGRVDEVDGDELVLEPVDDEGATLPLTVVMLDHVCTASYTDVLVAELPSADEPA